MKIVNYTIETFHHQQFLTEFVTDDLKTTNVNPPNF